MRPVSDAASQGSGTGTRAPARRAPAIAAALVVLWGVGYIARTSFVVDGRRYFGILDDVAISMAYARNLVEGRGLTWNAGGDSVEGFTHPLWLAPMIVAQASGLPPGARPLLVQILSLALLAAMPFVVARLARRLGGDEGMTLAVAATVALTAGCYPLAAWSLLGMETALHALLLAVAAERALTSLALDRPPGMGLYVALALGFCLRMDFLVGGGALFAALVASRPATLRHRSCTRGIGLLLGTVAALFAVRAVVFREWLPNTYYLKLTGVPLGVRLERGASVLVEHMAETWPFWVVLGLSVAALRRRPGARVLGSAIAAQVAYSVWVGGDVWDRWEAVGANRFIAPALPLAAVLAGAGIARFAPRMAAAPGTRRRVAAVATSLTALAMNGLLVGGPGATRFAVLVGLESPTQTEDVRELVTRLGRFVARVEPRVLSATVWAGWPAYLHPERRWYDVLGFNDRAGARAPAAVPLGGDAAGRFTPGHVKWDYERALGLGVGAFFQTWPRTLGSDCVSPLPAGDERAPIERAGFVCEDGFWLGPEVTGWSATP